MLLTRFTTPALKKRIRKVWRCWWSLGVFLKPLGKKDIKIAAHAVLL